MSDHGCVLAWLTGCVLALNAPPAWQAVWLVGFAVNWAYGLAALRERTRAVFVPGVA